MNFFYRKILLHAYGNPGRGDDGLGNALIERMEKWIAGKDIQFISTDSSYQLNIEDAETMQHYDIVIFVDASKAEIESFTFEQVHPESHSTFTTHSISPSSLVALCKELYVRTPVVYLLQIKGYEWEFEEKLSLKAEENLQKAVHFIQKFIIDSCLS